MIDQQQQLAELIAEAGQLVGEMKDLLEVMRAERDAILAIATLDQLEAIRAYLAQSIDQQRRHAATRLN